jgi:hypothetical protein
MTRKMGTTTKDRVLTLQHSYRKRSTVKRPSLFLLFLERAAAEAAVEAEEEDSSSMGSDSSDRALTKLT